MKNNLLIKWILFVFLLTIIIGRAFVPNKQVQNIQIIAVIGVIIAFADLYSKIYQDNYKKEKFVYVKGIIIIIFTILSIILGYMFLGKITLNNKANDILTILTLFISLPADLYCNWINRCMDR